MVVTALRQELAIAFLLVLRQCATRISIRDVMPFVCLADTPAFVNPMIRPSLRTGKQRPSSRLPLQLQQNRLSLETSPLIGGPSWLPLHVKVVLLSQPLCHQWDLIPKDPRNTTTLQKLITLQHVPAQIRYRIYNTTTTGAASESQEQDNGNQVSILEPVPLNTIIYDAETAPKMLDQNMQMLIDRVVIDQDQHDLWQAHRFCQSFMVRTDMELHLIWNNCWAFAIQLVFDLWRQFLLSNDPDC